MIRNVYEDVRSRRPANEDLHILVDVITEKSAVPIKTFTVHDPRRLGRAFMGMQS
jgi:hypothetical protein